MSQIINCNFCVPFCPKKENEIRDIELFANLSTTTYVGTQVQHYTVRIHHHAFFCYYFVVLSWLGSSESQDTLSEVLGGIASPVDTRFFCKSVDSSTMYIVTSMVRPENTVPFSEIGLLTELNKYFYTSQLRLAKKLL